MRNLSDKSEGLSIEKSPMPFSAMSFQQTQSNSKLDLSQNSNILHVEIIKFI